MDKNASIPESVFGGYEKIKQHPAGMVGSTALSFVPVVGGGVSAMDAANDFYHGRLASGAFNTGLAALSLVPGADTVGKGVVKGVGAGLKWLRPAMSTTKALRTVKPFVQAGQITGQLAGQLTAQHIDEQREMQRPHVQQQLAEQQQMMHDFNEWRQQRAGLQATRQPPTPATPDASPAPKMAADLSAGARIGHLLQQALTSTANAGIKGVQLGGKGMKAVGHAYENHPIPMTAATVALPAAGLLAAKAMKSPEDEFVDVVKKANFNLLDFSHAFAKEAVKDRNKFREHGAASYKQKEYQANAAKRQKSKKPIAETPKLTPKDLGAALQGGTAQRAANQPKPAPAVGGGTPPPPKSPQGLPQDMSGFSSAMGAFDPSASMSQPSMSKSMNVPLGSRLPRGTMPAVALAALAAMGGGAYMLGRKKRNAEDEAALQQMGPKTAGVNLDVAKAMLSGAKGRIGGAFQGIKGKINPLTAAVGDKLQPVANTAGNVGERMGNLLQKGRKSHAAEEAVNRRQAGQDAVNAYALQINKALEKKMLNRPLNDISFAEQALKRDADIRGKGYEIAQKHIGPRAEQAYQPAPVPHAAEGMGRLGDLMLKYPKTTGGMTLGAGGAAATGLGYGLYRGAKDILGSKPEQEGETKQADFLPDPKAVQQNQARIDTLGQRGNYLLTRPSVWLGGQDPYAPQKPEVNPFPMTSPPETVARPKPGMVPVKGRPGVMVQEGTPKANVPAAPATRPPTTAKPVAAAPKPATPKPLAR